MNYSPPYCRIVVNGTTWAVVLRHQVRRELRRAPAGARWEWV